MIKNEQERVRIGQRIADLRKTIKWKDGAGICHNDTEKVVIDDNGKAIVANL